MLTRAAGSQEDDEVHLRQCELMAGDKLLMCSDGLHGCVTSERIAAIPANGGKAADVAPALPDEARTAGAPDNVSIIIVSCAGADVELSDLMLRGYSSALRTPWYHARWFRSSSCFTRFSP